MNSLRFRALSVGKALSTEPSHTSPRPWPWSVLEMEPSADKAAIHAAYEAKRAQINPATARISAFPDLASARDRALFLTAELELSPEAEPDKAQTDKAKTDQAKREPGRSSFIAHPWPGLSRQSHGNIAVVTFPATTGRKSRITMPRMHLSPALIPIKTRNRAMRAATSPRPKDLWSPVSPARA